MIMSLSLNTIKSPKTVRSKRKRLGRGNASGRGTYSGRGIKGQRARSGGKKGLKYKGFKENLLRIPKLRGFKSSNPKKANVNLSVLNTNFNEGEMVNPAVLEQKGLIKDKDLGVKILSDGELSKKLIFQDCLFSKAAEEKVKKAGGKIEKEEQAAVSDKKESKPEDKKDNKK